MNRRLSILVALVAAGSLGVSLSSCNTPSCGPGTVQQQQKDGTLKCIPVDQQAAGIACDTDGGNVTIVGGRCVSAVQCDPASTMDINGVCVSTGGGPGPICRTPASGKGCLQGSIINFTDNKKGTTPIHVELWDPVALLTGGTRTAAYDSPDGGTYVFQDFNPPGTGLVVITTGKGTAGFVVAGSAGQGIGASTYTIDTYEVKSADVANWGFDITASGAFIAKFYKDPAPAAGTPVVATETMPVAGVTLIKDMMTAAGAQYFKDDLSGVNPALTSTGASGTAIVASPVTGPFPAFSGMGPSGMPITWETHPGGSAANLILILRFHPM